MNLSIKQKGYLFIAVAMVELSLVAILSSIGARSIGTIQLLFFVFLIAMVTSLLVIFYMKKVKQLDRLLDDKKSLATLSIAGVLNYAGAQLFFTLGVLGTNPVIVSTVLKLWPIMLAVMIPFTLRMKVEPVQLGALFLAFAGVYIIATNGSLISLNSAELPYIGFLILSALCTAVSTLMIKKQNHDIFAEVFVFNLASFATMLVISALFGVNLSVNLNLASVVSVLFLGVITYSTGALLFFYTLKALDPLIAANASYSTPFLTMVFSYFILGTQLKNYYIYSLALILGALFIQNKYSSKAPKFISSKEGGLQLYDVSGAFVDNAHPHIHSYMRNGRALAAKIKAEFYTVRTITEEGGCLIFNNRAPPESVGRQELDFIRDILAPTEDEIIVTGIGETEKVERALNDHMTA